VHNLVQKFTKKFFSIASLYFSSNLKEMVNSSTYRKLLGLQQRKQAHAFVVWRAFNYVLMRKFPKSSANSGWERETAESRFAYFSNDFLKLFNLYPKQFVLSFFAHR